MIIKKLTDSFITVDQENKEYIIIEITGYAVVENYGSPRKEIDILKEYYCDNTAINQDPSDENLFIIPSFLGDIVTKRK